MGEYDTHAAAAATATRGGGGVVRAGTGAGGMGRAGVEAGTVARAKKSGEGAKNASAGAEPPGGKRRLSAQIADALGAGPTPSRRRSGMDAAVASVGHCMTGPGVWWGGRQQDHRLTPK